MRFVDEALIQVKAGKGGNGCMSFRREKFIPRTAETAAMVRPFMQKRQIACTPFMISV